MPGAVTQQGTVHAAPWLDPFTPVWLVPAHLVSLAHAFSNLITTNNGTNDKLTRVEYQRVTTNETVIA